MQAAVTGAGISRVALRYGQLFRIVGVAPGVGNPGAAV